jgi:Protein of unknown function (DUF1592)/Protein of unknown function (DUF1588)/Protein of unknown function (DUF1595)/Protein of unknown function (DUF1585)/Protein of unknown function (DUF1587)
MAGVGGGGIPSGPNTAGLHPLRRMTQREYTNTVLDLFGDAGVVGPLPTDVDDPESDFAFHTDGDVGVAEALLYRDNAETLAQGAVANIGALLPCALTAGASGTEADCLETFFAPSGFAAKLFRRPLSTTPNTGEVDRLSALFAAARAAPLSLGFGDAIGLVIEAMLQSSEFLYHWEVDAGPAVSEGPLLKLGNYEIANRLSYLLWGTMPDDTLFVAAAAGQLGDAAGVESQIRRMVADPRAGGGIAAFFSDWLDIDWLTSTLKDSDTYPTYDSTLTTAMTGEVQNFVDAVVVNGSGRFDDLLTSTASFANQNLATLYGIAGITSPVLVPVALDPGQRSGLLTTAGFLSVTGDVSGSNPPRRGAQIYRRVLCGALAPPPADVPPLPPPPPPPATTRQRFAAVTALPCATACHSIIDPLGDTFENYDGIGAYRSLDDGLAVDASATVTLDGQPKMVRNAIDLMAALVNSSQAQTCFATQWLRFGLGRMNVPEDADSISAALAAFTHSLRDIRELLVALGASPTFRYRTPGTGEVLQ